MKTIIKTLLLTSAMLAIQNAQAADQQQGHQMGGHGSESACPLSSDQIAVQALSEAEFNTLAFMREEEKMARDVYNALYEMWGTRNFSNIAASEQSHMDKTKVFLDAYQITDPASPEVGVFNNDALQSFYDQLTARGAESELEAMKVGAMIEEVDIGDLQNAIAETDNEELAKMYTQLMLASHNHLRAFTSHIINSEGSYQAQVMPADEVAAILDSPRAEMNSGNAIELKTDGEVIESTACFISNLSVEETVLQNGESLSAEQAFSVEFKVTPSIFDQTQTVDWIAVAIYIPENSDQRLLFMRQDDSWQIWNGQIEQLASAGQSLLSDQDYQFSVFDGALPNVSGQLAFYSAYRLPNGNLVFTQFPTIVNLS